MFYSGISDEAGSSLEQQIRAHNELGWDHIELRNVDGENITAISDQAFDKAVAQLDESGLRVSCYGSAIANWARPITCDPQIDIDDLRRAIPRMQRTNTPFIRVMSYPNDPQNPLPEAEWRKEAIKRVKELAKIAQDAGVVLAHENCSGWGGIDPQNNVELLKEVDNPAFKVLYDTANPVSYGQDPKDYYEAIRDDICYVHIKDCKRSAEGKDGEYVYCGEGDGRVRETIADLFARGYDGGFSIEPHLAAIIHTGERTSSEQKLYETYTEYGRRLMKIIEEVRPS
jgi:sugar phosphate isomerase/epimerase